jgi:hypothetical protein
VMCAVLNLKQANDQHDDAKHDLKQHGRDR